MKINDEYDIIAAFEAIENELMSSMIRNLDRHRAEEIKEGYNWSMWQTEQLKALEKYKQKNWKKYSGQFATANKKIEELIRTAKNKGGMKQEKSILQAIRRGYKVQGKNSSPTHQSATAEFFKLNERKLEALIQATSNDMETAETAVLRMANDRYRKVIFSAQMYTNTGAGTYEKAVDMATKDFLATGLNCIEYKNGARHTLSDYADMAIRTANKRAYLQGEGEKRKEWGISTVIMNKRGNPCPKCLPFVGKVLIDDVWSGGSKDDGDYPFMSSAIAAGLYHPRCKDSHTTYFEGISTPPDDQFTKKELAEIEQSAKQEAQQQYAERQAGRFGRLAEYSLDPENKSRYEFLKNRWIERCQFKTGGVDSGEYRKRKSLPAYDFKALPQENVVNVLRKESREWIGKLEQNELAAIKQYTGSPTERRPKFYERLNAMLRGVIPYNDELNKRSEIISKALLKNELKHDIICYRTMDFNPYKEFELNVPYKELSFTSTSVIPSGALNKEFKITYIVKKGSRGAYIEDVSNYKKQREFLLDKGMKFRIINMNESEALLEVL